MGALAPVSPWMPGDDVLLKNAIEAGASLESLAKGAVQFSRKFTVRELQDRWYSLLYDPVVSAEAAFRMTEFEHSTSILPSKFNRAGNAKENKCFSGKRKTESVRSCYYALRKRIRHEPFNSLDLSFLVAPSNNNHAGNEYGNFSGQYMIGDPVSNHFVFEESNLDIMHHSFPQIVDSGTAHAYETQFQGAVQEDYPIGQEKIFEHIPHVLGENPSTTSRSVAEEFSQPKELPANDDPLHGCSNIDGNEVHGSPVPECGSSFHSMEYPSPLPEMPIWRIDEGISLPDLPDSLGLCDKDLHNEDAFSLLNDGDMKNPCSTGCDDLHKDSELKIEILSDELQNSSHSTEDFLAELNNYLSNDDEGQSMDVDGKALIDEYTCLMMSSTNNNNEYHMPNVTEPESSTPTDCPKNHSGACLGNLWENRGSHYSIDGGGDTDMQFVSSTSVLDPHPEVKEGVICCVLNTDNTEIPCNDDIIFPPDWCPGSISSVALCSFQHAGKLVSQRNGEVPLMAHGDLENPGQSHSSPETIRKQVMPESGLHHPVGNHGVKFELPGSDFAHRNANLSYGGPAQFNSANTEMETLVSSKLKEETRETPMAKHVNHDSTDSFVEKPAFASDCYQYPQTTMCTVKQVEDAPGTSQNHQVSHVKVDSTDMAASDQAVNHRISDGAEPPVETDEDVPYFSDIEAMILDMDLDPEDQDLYCSEEVSRYQHEDTKRAIIRLEQGARSYMQRAIASHGAFAVIYGRHSKHYIKKPEVLLGRGTDDVIVDIDLGREGRANKISRQQATIRMDKSGSFYLKNLGKCSLSVNDKEIVPGQSVILTSSCLIEIRGMPFIFEINQTCVMQYLNSIAQKNQTQEYLV